MTADEVLKEYAYTKIDYDLMALEGEAYTAWHTDAMADEIVRWRTLDNERKARRAAREPIHSLYDILVQLSEENDDLIEERNRLRQALREANRPPEDAEHHPYHWGEMADMAIDAAVRIAQSDTSRCLSCGAWV